MSDSTFSLDRKIALLHILDLWILCFSNTLFFNLNVSNFNLHNVFFPVPKTRKNLFCNNCFCSVGQLLIIFLSLHLPSTAVLGHILDQNEENYTICCKQFNSINCTVCGKTISHTSIVSSIQHIEFKVKSCRPKHFNMYELSRIHA